MGKAEIKNIIVPGDGGAYDLYGKTWIAYDHEPKEAQGK